MMLAQLRDYDPLVSIQDSSFGTPKLEATSCFFSFDFSCRVRKHVEVPAGWADIFSFNSRHRSMSLSIELVI